MKTINKVKLKGTVVSLTKKPNALLFSVATAVSKTGEVHQCSLFSTEPIEIKIGDTVTVEGSLQYPQSVDRINVQKLVCNSRT